MNAREGRALEPPEIIAHCQRNMAYFMVPRYLQFRASLPTTENLKVEKYRLRQDLERDIGQAWGREAAGILVAR